MQTPGDLIREAIAAGPIGLSQKSVARRAGISEKHLSQVIQGAARLGRHTAVRLEDELGISAVDLLVAQVNIDVAEARARRREQR